MKIGEFTIYIALLALCIFEFCDSLYPALSEQAANNAKRHPTEFYQYQQFTEANTGERVHLTEGTK